MYIGLLLYVTMILDSEKVNPEYNPNSVLTMLCIALGPRGPGLATGPAWCDIIKVFILWWLATDNDQQKRLTQTSERACFGAFWSFAHIM